MENINDMTEDEQIAALKAVSHSWFRGFVSIKNPSERVQIETVKRIPYKFDSFNGKFSEINQSWVDLYITSPKALELYKKNKKCI
jgi:hypothetical protein